MMDGIQPLCPTASRRLFRHSIMVGGVMLAAYLLLLNPWWTPGGDSELFVAAARSIVRGEGYTYNGKPVRIAPPAWSYVMAGAMWVSPTFLMIKCVTIALMTGAWVMAHRVMLRLAPPSWAACAAMLGAILVPVYSLTFWLHSEPLFCALAWGATLCAIRFAEDRRRTWDLLAVILLCGAIAGVRWTAGLQWGITAAAMAGGLAWRRERGGRLWLGLSLSGLVTVLVFVLLFFAFPRLAPAAAQDMPVTTQDAEDATPQLVDNTIFRDLSPWEERAVRLVAAGHWPAWALWYPTRFAGGLPSIAWIPLVLGWSVIGLLMLTAWRAVRSRRRDMASPPGEDAIPGAADSHAVGLRPQIGDWPLGWLLWPALVGYLFLLVVIWPLPNARYLVPVAPLLVLGVLWGCASLGNLLRRPRVGTWLRMTFIASLALGNGVMFAVDAAVQRSGDRVFGGSAERYYARYEAGLHVSLLQSILYLRDDNARDAEVAVSERYFNLNRMRFSRGGPRNVVMLLDRQVVETPHVYSFVPQELPGKLFRDGRVLPGGFAEWAQRNGVHYYLYQQPSEPWRLWHFRLPADLQERLSGADLEEPSFGWLLFTAADGFREPVSLPQSFEAPERIPGL